MNESQKVVVENTIKQSLRNKFKNYKPETKHMPFHHRLLGRDRMALFSFIHSLNTTFGISIYEPVAKSLAEPHFNLIEKQYVVGDQITETAQSEIESIISGLSSAESEVDKLEEIEKIRAVSQKGHVVKTNTVKVDIFAQDSDGCFHMFDLKTAKPNQSNFKDFKRTLLEWIAIFLRKNPDANVQSYIAIPYNPYEPKPYQRWTMKGMLDLEYELKVGPEFWNFIGGGNVYEPLLDCFENAGKEMHDEINDYFLKFK